MLQVHKNFEISENQKEYTLKMFEFCFKQEFPEGSNFPIFKDDYLLINENQKVYWIVALTMITDVLLDGKHYWQDRFYTKCFQYKNSIDHPVDFLFERFNTIINKEPLFKKTELEFVLENQEKENKREAREAAKKEKEKDKALEKKYAAPKETIVEKPVVEETIEEEEEEIKPVVKIKKSDSKKDLSLLDKKKQGILTEEEKRELNKFIRIARKKAAENGGDSKKILEELFQ